VVGSANIANKESTYDYSKWHALFSFHVGNKALTSRIHISTIVMKQYFVCSTCRRQNVIMVVCFSVILILVSATIVVIMKNTNSRHSRDDEELEG
jgi:hypothetical protein